MDFTEIKPGSQTTPADGTVFYDFGKHAFGLFEVTLDAGSTPQEIELAAGEVVADGRINTAPGGSRIYHEEKISLPEGVSTWRINVRHPGYGTGTLQTDPDIIPFRYAEIRNFNGKVIKAVQLAVFRYFDDEASYFHCNIALMDQIWDFCKYSIKATNCFGIFVDGNRERQAYEGDTYVNLLSYFVCNSDPEMPRNTIDRLIAYPTWPTEWQLSMLPIVLNYLLYTGDFENVRRWMPALQKKLLTEAIMPNGLLNVQFLPEDHFVNGHGDKIKLKDIVDWPISERDGYEFSKTNLVPNCWLYMALNCYVQLAKFLGMDDEAEHYAQIASYTRHAIRQSMLKNGIFRDNPDSLHTSIHSCIFPVLWGIAGDGERKAMLELMKSKAMACSVFAAQFLLECCCTFDMQDHAIELITSKELRSWYNMMKKGATITMEAWDDTVKPNQDWNHAWATAPLNIIVRHLAGIRPVEPGFKKFVVDPKPGRMTKFSLVIPTPAGPISFRLKNCEYTLNVPPGITPIIRGKEYPASRRNFTFY